MKRKEIKALHDKTIKELDELLSGAYQNLAKSRLELAAGKIKDTKILVKLRDDLARIQTVLKERQPK